MSEALLKQAPVLDRQDAVADLLPTVRPSEVNDNDAAAALPAGEARHFEIPARIWWAMIACYAVFLTAMFAATGGGYASLVLAVAAGFVAMFFGTARAMLGHGPAQPRSPLDGASGVLPTLYGPLRAREVATQMLVVPACVAFFGVAILVIRLWVA
jgi:hypothetical protein